MVPNKICPASAARLAPATLSNNHLFWLPKNTGQAPNQFWSDGLIFTSSFNFSHNSAVRRSCQTMARWIGLPVFLSHNSVVSRWLVMPIAATASGETPACLSTARKVDTTDCQISSPSCSTQPGCGNIAEIPAGLQHRFFDGSKRLPVMRLYPDQSPKYNLTCLPL